jgi:hypothetical protein
LDDVFYVLVEDEAFLDQRIRGRADSLEIVVATFFIRKPSPKSAGAVGS